MLVSSNKRGQSVLDVLYIIVGLFIIALGVLIFYKIYDDMNSFIQDDPDLSAEAKAASGGGFANYPTYMDNAFVLLLGLLWVSLIVTSFLLDTHPVFFIITVILLVFVFIVAMVLANTYQDVASENDFLDASIQFPKTMWVFENFLLVIICMAMSSILALYAKARL